MPQRHTLTIPAGALFEQMMSDVFLVCGASTGDASTPNQTHLLHPCLSPPPHYLYTTHSSPSFAKS